MHKSNSRWHSFELWQCMNHVPPLRLPERVQSCYMHGCQSCRPEEAARPELVVKPVAVSIAPVFAAGVNMCQWDGCDNAARPRSKYCSRECSNRNARARYRKRGNVSAA